jgi:hypothetical protein
MRLALRILLALALVGSIGVANFFLPSLMGSVVSAPAIVSNVSVDPAPLSITCPGAFVEAGGKDGTDLGLVQRIGEASAVAHFDKPLLSPLENQFIESQDLKIEGEIQSTSLLSANQYQGVSRERAAGLSALDCSENLVSGWFINGEAGVGRESILVLSNPSPTEVNLTVSFFAPSGNVSDRFSLAVGESKLVTLAKYVLADDAFAVYFETDGVKVAASLQNRNIVGLTPQGIELVAPVPALSTSIVIPGVGDFAPGFKTPELRVFNPGTTISTVRVYGLGSEGRVLLQSLEIPASSLSALNLDITEPISGIALEADAEILAGIKSTSLDPVLDFAWLLPASRFEGLAVIPNNLSGSLLNIANPTDSSISVSVGRAGSYQSLVIGAFGSISLPVKPGDLDLQSSVSFFATLSLFTNSGYSVITPGTNSNSKQEVAISVSSGRGE